ncbi:MAG: hypothetical protein Q8O03_06120 [Nanoarchaeota archaeon]|nr:hypothetical protein [Nanoarchaeota archaeon]
MIKIASKEPPTEDVLNLRNQNMNNAEIINELVQRGFNNQQIFEAINQADIKGGVGGKVPQEAPQGMRRSALTSGNDESEIPIPVPSPESAEEEPAPRPRMRAPEIQPSAQVYMQGSVQQPQMDIESMQEIVESIIDERWQEVVASVGDITIWKSRVDDDLSAIKQEVLRVEDRFTKLQASILGKVDEYQKGITQVSSEMVALEQVFGKIMEPLTSNIKELQRLTQDMKKKS